MKSISFVVFALVAASLTAPALAQQGGGGGGGPGRMTPEERAARFDASDTDKDGKLTKAEWTATLPEQARDRAEMMWARLDADGDGSVTKEQFVALRMGPGGGGGQPGQ